MRRYLKLYYHFLCFSFNKSIQFRVDFSFRIIMDVIYYSTNILFFKTIFLHSNSITGWREDQIMVFVSSYLLVDALHMTFFSSNMWWLPYFINQGDLDYYLTKPVSSLFFLSLKDIAFNSMVNLFMAIGLMWYALFNYQEEVSFLGLVGYLLLIINGAIIQYLIQLLMIIPTFWTGSPKGFNDFLFSITIGGERPDRIYRGFLKVLFTYIIPLSIITSYPARLFLDGWSLSVFSHIIGVTLTLWVLASLLWKQGLKNYSSASS